LRGQGLSREGRENSETTLVAQVFHHDGTLGQVQGSGFLHLMLPGGGDGHKGRQVDVVVQEGVELEPRLGAPARSPGEKRQAEAHHRGVQAAKLIFELEICAGGHGPGSADT